jgi:Tfp pilus assembly protein PilF
MRSPEAAQLYNNLGSSYARLNLEKLSMSAFTQAIEIYVLHPHMDCSPLYSNIAGIYLKAGMPSAAEVYYLKALAECKQKRPNLKELLFHCHRKVAQAKAQLGKFTEAE